MPLVRRARLAAGKFCRSCGTSLADATVSPVRDPRAYTPKHLAEKILTTRAALEGERKQVTVLFADVKGSLELAEQVDPEEWNRTLDRFFTILADGVHRSEGTVNQNTGDGIMALFGAPIAHDDHAQRGCWGARSGAGLRAGRRTPPRLTWRPRWARACGAARHRARRRSKARASGRSPRDSRRSPWPRARGRVSCWAGRGP